MAGDHCTTEAVQPLSACRLLVCVCVSQLLLGPQRHNDGPEVTMHELVSTLRMLEEGPLPPPWPDPLDRNEESPNAREKQSVAANLHLNGIDTV